MAKNNITEKLEEKIKEYTERLNQHKLELEMMKLTSKSSEDLKAEILKKTIALPEIKARVEILGNIVRDLKGILNDG